MIARYNRSSLLFHVPGVILQLVAGSAIGSQLKDLMLLGWLSWVFGTVLLAIGLAYDAKAKGRSLAWCLMAFLSIWGVFVLALLEDRSGSTAEVGDKHVQA